VDHLAAEGGRHHERPPFVGFPAGAVLEASRTWQVAQPIAAKSFSPPIASGVSGEQPVAGRGFRRADEARERLDVVAR
jgi:hypothetical protein